jgi:alpha-L-fucosidase
MKHFFNLMLLLFFVVPARSQTTLKINDIQTPKAVIADFMDQRFGMFIHWGPVTLRGTEIGWSRGNEVPIEDYDQLYKEFDPRLFNADKWAQTAKDAGMKYLTITAKHHDGFCLWPTAYSDYNIMNSPFKRDVVGELAAACKKYDIKFCVYFTVLDWHDPNYAAQPGSNVKPDMGKFVTTMKNQLTEIIQNYHPYMLWFDGNWESQWNNGYANEVFAHIKKLSPNVIVNNRLKSPPKGSAMGSDHPILIPGTVGDYATPEQKTGKLNIIDPWETCMTIANHWSWMPNDKLKSLKQCIQTLASTSGGNGNLLFNVGPMPDGRIEARQVTRLKEMGDWLKLYGESIYGTKGGPYAPTDVFATTRKNNVLYVHVFQRKSAELLLGGLKGFKVLKASFIKGSKVAFQQNDAKGEVVLQLPDALPESSDAVIKLELDKNAELIPIVIS